MGQVVVEAVIRKVRPSSPAVDADVRPHCILAREDVVLDEPATAQEVHVLIDPDAAFEFVHILRVRKGGILITVEDVVMDF